MESEIIPFVFRVIAVVAASFLGARLMSILWGYVVCYLHFELGRSGFPRGPSAREFQEVFRRDDLHRLLVEWVNDKYGPMFWYRVLGNHAVAITDPWLVREVLSRPEDFDKATFIFRPIDKMTGPHGKPSLMTHPTNDHWHLIRKGVMPAFSAGNLKKGYQHVQTACSNLVDLLAAMPPETVLDMQDILSRESMDVIGLIGFGRDMGATKSLGREGQAGQALEVAVACTHEIEEFFKDPLRQLKFWKKSVREGKRAFADMHAVMGRLLQDTIDNQSKLDPHSIAAHLLGIRDPKTGARLPFETLLPEVSFLFFAGYDTTGHTMSYTLYLLSQHPEVEAKVVAELARHGLLASLGKPRPRLVQWTDLSKLTYLNAVIKEAQRLYSIAANAPLKYALRDVKLGGGKYTIPKGVMLHMPVQALHCSKYNWDKPYDFIPERWLEVGTEIARHVEPDATESADAVSTKHSSFASVPGTEAASTLQEKRWEAGMTWDDGSKVVKRYMPFSEGTRSCPGMSLAKVNLTACLATLLGHFSFRLADEMGGAAGVRRAEQMALTMSCKGGMKMHCESRRKMPHDLHVAAREAGFLTWEDSQRKEQQDVLHYAARAA